VVGERGRRGESERHDERRSQGSGAGQGANASGRGSGPRHARRP
jgi:hypothetical protein